MRIVPLSAAAAAVVAVGLAALLASPTSVALAEVIQAARQHKLVKYRSVQGIEVKDGSAVQPQRLEAYADLTAPRFRTVEWSPGTMKGALDFESVFVLDGVKGVSMHRLTETVTEKGKTDPEAIEQLKLFEDNGTPRRVVTLWDFREGPNPAIADAKKSILENLRDLETHKDSVATKGKFRGADVLKYRIEEGARTTLLLVDAATKLPIRLEYESTDPRDTGPEYVLKVNYVLSDFEWDPDLKGVKGLDELFSVEPAAGYKVDDRREPKGKTVR